MHVIATAGHVDHGKSTLVRALTGMEPDRWSEERRRGMTIDLGYAWTTVGQGSTVAFVDVPGHERFIGNMLAGLGPVSAVMFVVAADEGWKEQSAEHLLAVDALGLTTGLLVVTRSDLADPAPAVAAARSQLAASSLGEVPYVNVSGRTGAGLPELRDALARLVDTLPEPRPDGRLRLWIDRSFTIRGSGTVVTGTLTSGTLAIGDEVELATSERDRRLVRIRGLQTLGVARDRVGPVARVAVNVRQLAAQEFRRGDALLSAGAWRPSTVLEGRIGDGIERGFAPGVELGFAQGAEMGFAQGAEPGFAQHVELPGEVTLHLGTAAVPARVRPLGPGAVRLLLQRPLPVQPGDRALLQDQTTRRILTGVTILDVEPPDLRRRGSAAARAEELARGEVARGRATLARRGAILATELAQRGETVAPSEAISVGRWLVSVDQRERWVGALREACVEQQRGNPLRPGLSTAAASRAIGLPDPALLPFVVDAADLALAAGAVHVPGIVPDLGVAERGLRKLEEHLRSRPFDAPDRPRLDELKLGPKELSTAVALGRVIRLGPDVILLPEAPATAMRALAALPQPFTTSAARAAWGTTRRVAIPLLEHLDQRGWTRRISAAGEREVVRR